MIAKIQKLAAKRQEREAQDSPNESDQPRYFGKVELPEDFKPGKIKI